MVVEGNVDVEVMLQDETGVKVENDEGCFKKWRWLKEDVR